MTPTSRFRRLTRTVVARAGLAALLAGLAVSPAFAANNLEITALSNRPDKISGGDVLVRIDVPAGVALGDVKVQLNGRDATSQFRPDPSGHALLGLVTGLELGQNQIQASAKKASTGKLKLVNYPITGPIFSGPQEEPFFCQTHQFTVFPTGPTLTSAQIQDPCMVPTRVDYVYRTTGGAFPPPAPSAPPPPARCPRISRGRSPTVPTSFASRRAR